MMHSIGVLLLEIPWNRYQYIFPFLPWCTSDLLMEEVLAVIRTLPPPAIQCRLQLLRDFLRTASDTLSNLVRVYSLYPSIALSRSIFPHDFLEPTHTSPLPSTTGSGYQRLEDQTTIDGNQAYGGYPGI